MPKNNGGIKMQKEDKIEENKSPKGNKLICIVKGEKPKKGEPIIDFHSVSDMPAHMNKIFADLAKKIPTIDVEKEREEYKKNNSAKDKPSLYSELLENIERRIKKIEYLISNAGITLPENEGHRLALLFKPKDGSALDGEPSYYLRVLLQFARIKREIEKISNNPDALTLAKEMLCAGEDYSIITRVLPHANAAKTGYSLGRKNDVTEELILEFDKQYRERIKNGDSEKAAKTYASKYCQGKWRETNLDIESNPKGKAPSNDTFIKAWKKSAKDK